MDKRILLVDDDPLTLRMAGLALHREGYEVSVAQNGREALESLERDLPDLVILDVMMPDMDGRLSRPPSSVCMPTRPGCPSCYRSVRP